MNGAWYQEAVVAGGDPRCARVRFFRSIPIAPTRFRSLPAVFSRATSIITATRYLYSADFVPVLRPCFTLVLLPCFTLAPLPACEQSRQLRNPLVGWPSESSSFHQLVFSGRKHHCLGRLLGHHSPALMFIWRRCPQNLVGQARWLGRGQL